MLRSWTALVVGITGLSSVVCAQDWQESLGRIAAVAQRYCDRKVAEACNTVSSSTALAQGLSGGWSSSSRPKQSLGGWSAAPRPNQPPPKEYSENLDSLATELEAVAQAVPTDGQPKKELVAAFALVGRDLEAKSTDCETFGMGRLLQVTLRTVHSDNTVVPGWEVLYKCSLITGETGEEMQAPGLTATSAQLPPGATCRFRARKAAQETPSIGPIPIFAPSNVAVDIPVP